MTDEDFRRLEGKVDKLADAVMKLVLVEERQVNQGERIGKVEQRIAAAEVVAAKTDKVVHQWVNRGVGAWAIAAVIFAIAQLGTKFMGNH